MKNLEAPRPTNAPTDAPDHPVRVVEYTDPHSIWCWGFEPTIRRLELVYPQAIQVEVRMGGLFEDFGPMREYWTRMSGGRWKESVRAFMSAVAGQHRMPMNADAILDGMAGFESTWPACVAVKAAERLGVATGRRYLRRLREAFLLEGQAIHRSDVQLDLAEDVGIEPGAFRTSLDDGTAEQAFREDLDECRSRGVTGFPTILVHRADMTIRVEGWVPWDVFEARLEEIGPVPRARRLGSVETSIRDALGAYGRCATREVAAILGVSDDEAEIHLDELAARDLLVRQEMGSGVVWTLAEGIHVKAGPRSANPVSS